MLVHLSGCLSVFWWVYLKTTGRKEKDGAVYTRKVKKLFMTMDASGSALTAGRNMIICCAWENAAMYWIRGGQGLQGISMFVDATTHAMVLSILACQSMCE